MSIWDEFRDLATQLVDDFELPEVTLTRTTTAPPTPAQRAAGQGGTTTTQTIRGRGKIGPRERQLADGSIRTETVATMTVEPRVGDKFTIGARTYTVETVSENAPDGGAGIMFSATVK